MAVNFALASNGATVVATSTASAAYPESSVINGNRTAGGQWGAGGGWSSLASPSPGAPQAMEITFPVARLIGEIDVFTLPDNLSSTTPPTLTDQFTQYGIVDFIVQYWTGSVWATVATVTGNNKVWRQFTFSPVTTTKIRVSVTGVLAAYARIIEIEAWGTLPPEITSNSPLSAALTGKPYSYQLQKSGGTGAGTWAAISGNLPNGAIGSSGLITIPVVGNTNYTFTTRFTDANGTFVEKSLTIPVFNLASVTLCYRHPLAVDYIQRQRFFEPIEGSDEVIEDAPQKREWTMTIQYIGGAEGDTMRQFLYDHRLRQPFVWINPDRNNEAIAVKMVSKYNEQQILAYGDFEIVLREV